MVRIVFAGTPEFAAVSLRAVAGAGHSIPLVLTQPDRPRGRGLKPAPSPVKTLAREWGLPVAQPDSLRDSAILEQLSTLAPDALVVVAYGLMLPKAVLALPSKGCLNVHASLLPRWRGAAPIARALLAGDAATGVTIMKMDEGLDTGPMLLQRRLSVAPRETAGTLHDKLASLGAEALLEALQGLEGGRLAPEPQPQTGVCYGAKIRTEEARVAWERSAEEVDRLIRAFDPAPGARTLFQGEMLKLWAATPMRPPLIPQEALPGQILAAGAAGIQVACGQGVLRIDALQRAGGRRMSAEAFLKGFDLRPGDRLGR